ncbi:hypothetical protein SAMCFNEI73_Ch3695 [Sinorhizobium americanum]|uniref:Uncharacterized protein n=1 Tax=Sinorhizobium americanum TaxID=194963 RepID=A0A1L3LS73_9HYPH|nr:hypothetical protein SAMCFNEI73_Ch3695 [Sinorhizobium americanum]OAP49208.1 hypothetical protein ATC00_09340 [Sinorhizobium americanum]
MWNSVIRAPGADSVKRKRQWRRTGLPDLLARDQPRREGFRKVRMSIVSRTKAAMALMSLRMVFPRAVWER